MTNKIILDKVRCKNFRSVGNSFIEVDLSSNRSTLVVSEDNGAGKSTTTLVAIYYALFDRAYGEKARKTSLINSKSNKDSLVEVDFQARGSKYTVRRGQKPSVFEVIENGVAWENDAEGRDNQARLLEVLGMDHVIFENIVGLGRDRFVPFIKMDASTRRHVADEMLNTGIFAVMGEVAKEDVKELNQKVGDVEFVMNTVSTKLESVERLIGQNNTHRGEIVDGARARIGELDAELERTRDMRQRLDTKRQETAGEAAEQADKLQQVRAQLQTTTEGFTARINQVRESTASKVREYREKCSSELKELSLKYNARCDEITRESEAAVSEANGRLLKAQGLMRDLSAKRDENRTKAANFRSLGDCPTCLQVVGDDHKERIAGELEEAAGKLDDGIQSLQAKLDEASEAVLLAKNSGAKARETNAQDNAQRVAEIEAEWGIAPTNKIEAEANRVISDISAECENACRVLKETLEPLVSSSQTFSSKLSELDVAIGSLDGKLKSLEAEKANQQQVIERNLDSGADERLKELESEKAELVGKKTELEGRYNDLKDELASYQELLVILKDNGAKADVVKQYIPFFNQRVNRLLDAMGMYVNFVMDEDFGVEMADPTRKNQNLYDLSTGQQRRIDLAILFTWREIAAKKSSVSCNLLILDEVLENLSQQGVIDFMAMFEAELQGTNLMVITQREDEFSEYFDNVIKYRLREDFTVPVHE